MALARKDSGRGLARFLASQTHPRSTHLLIHPSLLPGRLSSLASLGVPLESIAIAINAHPGQRGKGALRVRHGGLCHTHSTTRLGWQSSRVSIASTRQPALHGSCLGSCRDACPPSARDRKGERERGKQQHLVAPHHLATQPLIARRGVQPGRGSGAGAPLVGTLQMDRRGDQPCPVE